MANKHITMKQLFAFLLVLAALSMSCGRVKKTAKDAVNKSGETVGSAATEFVEGVSQGVEQTLQCEISLSPDLQKKGVKTGKFSVKNDTLGSNNQLTLYLIFDKDFNAPLTAKVFDKNGLETGRSKLTVEAKSGDAGYYDFIFDRRTYIEAKSKIEID